MKKTINLSTMAAICLFIILFMAFNAINAQSLTIKGNVTLENKSTLEKYKVQVLDMDLNECIEFDAFKTFTHKLVYDHSYMVIISRNGFQSKSIYVNTDCKINKSFKFKFDCNLEPDDVHDNIVCQAGGVFFDKKDKEFTYYYHK